MADYISKGILGFADLLFHPHVLTTVFGNVIFL
jgi:hypothetical protein